MFLIEPRRSEAPSGPHFASHTLIAAGGTENHPEKLKLQILDLGFSHIIAADGGLRLLKKLNLPCHLLVGDFDTLTTTEVEQAQSDGIQVIPFPSDKAKSDLEIAIDHAVARGTSRVTVIGALGGEIDHHIQNLLAPLSLCADYGVWARLVTSSAQVYLAREPVVVRAPRHRVSLAALSVLVSDLDLRGFQFELRNAELKRNQTLGLANATTQAESTIAFSQGELLITVSLKRPR